MVGSGAAYFFNHELGYERVVLVDPLQIVSFGLLEL